MFVLLLYDPPSYAGPTKTTVIPNAVREARNPSSLAFRFVGAQHCCAPMSAQSLRLEGAPSLLRLSQKGWVLVFSEVVLPS
jgi:hypothetical protein